jgi:probable phosphoglycerate mutase
VTRLLLTRHGQSEWNAEGRWQGQADPPLTELGRRQALHAAKAIGAIDAVHCSPLQRAADTAHLVAEELGVGPVMEEGGLAERCAGEWEGLTRAEIEDLYPGFLDDGRRPPGWEDDTLVDQRVFGALDRIARLHPRSDVLAVAHAGVIFAVERVLGASWERLANLGGRWLEHRDGSWVLGPRVHLLVEETIPDQL